MSMSVATASLIGAGLSLTGGLFSNRTNRKIAEENLAYQREANEKNMQLTKEANEANIQLQRDINNQNIAFQQRENDITRMREDNAVQRAAADMTAAGLSKTLAAGNPASAQSLSAPQAEAPQVQRAQVQALNNQYKYESALQKMNIASLMLDIASKNESLKQSKALNDAQVANIKANTDNTNLQNSVYMDQYNNKKLLMESEIASNYASAEASKASARLNNIVGDYKAQELEAEIAFKVNQALYYKSQALYTDKSREKIAFDIAESIARSNKLNKEAEVALQDLAYRKLQVEALTQDVGVAKKYGFPVGYMPSGIFGGAFSTAAGIAGLAQFKFPGGSNLNLTPYEQMVLGMSGNVGTYLPPVT